MRDLFSKVMTGSMIAGAALLVSACGGGEEANTNNTAYADDALMEAGTNDVTAIDAGTTGADANLGLDANMTVDTNTGTGTGTTTTTNTTTDTTATNGM